MRQFTLNEEGRGWARRIKNDSKKAIFIILPFVAILHLFFGLSQSNFRPSLALLVIIPPLAMFWYLFYYVALVKRGEKVKKVISSVSVKGESVKLCTSNWLYSSGHEYEVARDQIRIEENHSPYMQQDCNYRIAFPYQNDKVELYFIPHFIQDGREVLSLLDGSQ
ncbi:MAG: hypothetical protein HC842_03445 [Cytophagales bacterium]|nr:hypothetical protein [Cytophagales bacterium]